MKHAIARKTDGGTDLGAPTVGVFVPAIATGALVAGGEALGTLEILGRKSRVTAPELVGLHRVSEIARGPVEYGQTIVGLTLTGSEPEAFLPDGEDDADLPAGAQSVKAPIDGMFFSSPSPDDPPFVEVGATVSADEVVGLVEVMKFFYEIRTDVLAGTVVRIDAVNGEVVTAGDVVVWIVP